MPPVAPRSQQRRRHHRLSRCSPALRIALVALIAIITSLCYLRLHAALSPTLRRVAPWASSSSSTSLRYSTKMTSQSASTSSTRGDLKGFLRNARQSALAHLEGKGGGSRNPLVLIMGNGAGDADSLTSAISLSYLLTTYPHSSLPLASPLPDKAIYAPLIQTNRSDAHLRPENVAILAATGIDQQDILYLSDLTDSSPKGLSLELSKSPALSPEHNTYLGLVDHPQLELPWTTSPSSSSLRRVILVVDHHADAGKHQDAQLRVFRQPEGSSDPNPTGSAQSIVIELFAKEIAKDPSALPKELADLAIATVLIDTDNMRPAPKGRASKTDFAAVEALLPLSSLATAEAAKELQGKLLSNSPQEVQGSLADSAVSSSSFDESSDMSDKTSAMSNVLSANKAAISHLSSLDLLKRDYKSSSLTEQDLNGKTLPGGAKSLKAGFSSVNLGLPAWLHRGEGMSTANQAESSKAWAAFWQSLQGWMQDQVLDVAVVGTSFRDEENGKHRRELVVAMRTGASLKDGEGVQKLFDQVKEKLEDPKESPLELETPWKGARLASTGKKERVSGIEEETGKLEFEGESSTAMWAQVWKQGNARANRKVYLPEIMAALKGAAS